MGAENFVVRAYAPTAEEAFRQLVDQARYDYGHSGYTGTIAEKHDFVYLPEMEKIPEDMRVSACWEATCESGLPDPSPLEPYQEIIKKANDRVDDKWGPVGCCKGSIDETRGQLWIFFGWASS